MQVSKSGIKSDVQTEVLTDERWADFCPVWICGCLEKQLIYVFLSQQGSRARIPYEEWKWVTKVSEVERIGHFECRWSSIKALDDINTFFSGCLFTQRKIPSRNCWSLRLTRSTRWRRYNNEGRRVGGRRVGREQWMWCRDMISDSWTQINSE